MAVKRWLSVATCLLLLFCGLHFFWAAQKEHTLLHHIQNIPPEDRSALEGFFRILLLEEGGAYVLFGDKPVAFTAYFHSCEWNIRSKKRWDYYSENQKITNGWKTWKKYQNLFPSDHFALECRAFGDGRSEICLINRKKWVQIVQDNLTYFRSVLGGEVDPANLLNDYLEGNTALFNLFHKHHVLLGIVLGFGTQNAQLFNEYAMRLGEDPHAIRPVPRKLPSDLVSDPYPLESLFGERRKGCQFLWLPYCLADPNSLETQAIRQKYLKQRQEIHHRYTKENFLEVSLKKFCLD